MFFLKKKLRAGLLTNRVEALSDSIFGFAITLLVLSIAVPELTQGQLQKGELAPALISLWPKFLTYLVSAFVISIFWVGHTMLFHFIKRADRIFIWFNTFFMIFIAFFPFPVALLSRYHLEPSALFIYGATIFTTGIFFCAMWLYASGGRRLINEKLTPELVRKGNVIVFGAPVIYAVALIFTFINIWITIAIYILVPILYTIPSAVDEIVDAAGD